MLHNEFNDGECLVDPLPLESRRLEFQEKMVNDLWPFSSICQISHVEELLVGDCPLIVAGDFDEQLVDLVFGSVGRVRLTYTRLHR